MDFLEKVNQVVCLMHLKLQEKIASCMNIWFFLHVRDIGGCFMLVQDAEFL